MRQCFVTSNNAAKFGQLSFLKTLSTLGSASHCREIGQHDLSGRTVVTDEGLETMSMYSRGVMASGGRVGDNVHLKFLTFGKLWENLLVKKCSDKNAKFKAETPPWRNLRRGLKL